MLQHLYGVLRSTRIGKGVMISGSSLRGMGWALSVRFGAPLSMEGQAPNTVESWVFNSDKCFCYFGPTPVAVAR